VEVVTADTTGGYSEYILGARYESSCIGISGTDVVFDYDKRTCRGVLGAPFEEVVQEGSLTASERTGEENRPWSGEARIGEMGQEIGSGSRSGVEHLFISL
jgi:hypothetical protein